MLALAGAPVVVLVSVLITRVATAARHPVHQRSAAARFVLQDHVLAETA